MYKQLFSYEDIFQSSILNLYAHICCRYETSFSKNTYYQLARSYLFSVSAGGKGQFPPYKRLTNGLPCSHQPSGLPFPIKEPSNMIKEELTYIIGIIAPTSSKKYYYLKNKFEVHLQLSGLGVSTALKQDGRNYNYYRYNCQTRIRT